MGDRAASREHTFRAIYEQHGAAVHAYVARRVADAYVEDLVSETFMVAWRKLPKDVMEPLPWLYAVARREVANHRRKLAGGHRLVERLAALTPLHERAVPPLVVDGLRAAAGGGVRAADRHREGGAGARRVGAARLRAGRARGRLQRGDLRRPRLPRPRQAARRRATSATSRPRLKERTA